MNSIVISQKLADQFFPGENPVGREMEGVINNSEQLLVVNWNWDFWNSWILRSENAEAAEINEQFDAFERKHISEDPRVHYSLQNLSDFYLKSEAIANTWPTGNIKNIRLFSTVAFLILLIATFNYIILSIAVSTGRVHWQH